VVSRFIEIANIKVHGGKSRKFPLSLIILKNEIFLELLYIWYSEAKSQPIAFNKEG
jgi:hypothetical protein